MSGNKVLVWGSLLIGFLFFMVTSPEGRQQRYEIQFVDVTLEAGIDFVHTFGDRHLTSILETTGSGAAFLDYDNDGDLDIYLVNGSWLEGISDPEERQLEESTNRLYRNNGDGTFTDVTDGAGVGDRGYGMGVAIGDYDNDGDIDIYVANDRTPNFLYRNNGDG
ncbi:MAG TPA: VCBS repeat-containing protein, partial [Candidatus Latescibacteria bacterium]|nr:VCBS repeat-containing protein [Candidatus Latescibacterota bacterium]